MSESKCDCGANLNEVIVLLASGNFKCTECGIIFRKCKIEGR